MKKLLSAIAYMHNKKIIHRDLKLENMVFRRKFNKESTEEEIDVKIIDFGASKELNCLYTKDKPEIGTTSYMAPEVFEGFYSPKCDIWSCGVIFYVLCIGLNPFKTLSKL